MDWPKGLARPALSVAAVLLLAVACKRNRPPSVPEVTGRLACRPGDTAELSATSTDQDDDLVSYLFAWGDTSSAEWTPDYPSGVTVTRGHAYAESGAYAVRARARDDKGAESEWSPTETLRVGVFSPGIPVRPAGPTTWEWGTVYACSTSATSPYGESLFIQYDWGGSLGDWGGQVASDSFRIGTHMFDSIGPYAVRARSMDKVGVTSVWSDSLVVVVGCSSNYRPDVPATPSGPDTCFKDTTYTFKTVATDPDGDSVAVRFAWGHGDTSDWSSYVAAGESVAMTHAWSAVGLYELTAQARDQQLHGSGWSGAHRVQVVLRRPPNTPDAPTGPWEGGQDTSYIFKAVASHPDDITAAIRLDWGDGDTSDWSSFAASGETTMMSHAWSAPGTYGVKAQAKDTGNVLSQWSLPHGIIIHPTDTLRIWRYLTGGVVRSSPAIAADGTVYVGSYDNLLYAINPDGTLKWSFLTGGNVPSSPAIAADGTVYVGSNDDYLYALNPDGTLKWRYLTGRLIYSSPAVAADGTIYCGSYDNYLYALNPDSTLKWRYQTGSDIHSSPAIAADGTVYVGSNDDYLYALNPDGTLKWSYRTGDAVRSSPAVGADGTVYVGSLDHWFYAINPDGALSWRTLAGKAARASPAVGADNTVYVGSDDGNLYALNPNGTIKWAYKTGGTVNSCPAIGADGTVYCGSDDSYLYAVNPDGTLKWRYETGGDIESSPTIGPDGTIYFASYDGYLYALKGTGALADSSWPKFRHDLRNTGRVGGGR